MDETRLRHLLRRLRDGSLDEESALAELRTLPVKDLGFANVDNHRGLR